LPTGGRKPGHCAATLVAEALSLDDDSILKPLLKFTLSRDIEQGGGSFELPALIKALWASDTGGIDRDQVVLAWAFSIYGAMYQRGANFSEGTIQDYQNAGKVTIKDDSGRRINFVYGHSDSSEFGKFARYKKAGIVLWMKSGGNVIIQTDRRLNIELAPVVRAIRIAEMCEQYRLKPSQAPFPLTASQGCAEGTIDECPAWFFHENARAIMNGLESHAVAPTLLSLERLANIIQAVLHKNPPRRVSFPQKGRVFVRLAGVRPSPILMPQTAEAISTDVISVDEQPLGSEMLQ